MQIVRIRETGNALAITIPRPYLEQLGWGLGENLMLEIVAGNCLQARAIPYPHPVVNPQEKPAEGDNGAHAA